MAIGDSYATAAEYRARNEKSSAADDAEILTQLTSVSRLLDRECERHFTKDASIVARLYDGDGCSVLRVDDIATVTGLLVKVDLDYDFAFTGADETLTINTHFWVSPANAALEAEPEPWTRLELVPNNSVLSVWPAQRRAVQVTAVFGWPTVPGAIKEAVIVVTRELRDLQEAGATNALQAVDQVINLSPVAFSMVERIKAKYSRAAVVH